jgi:hypothetical protein
MTFQNAPLPLIPKTAKIRKAKNKAQMKDNNTLASSECKSPESVTNFESKPMAISKSQAISTHRSPSNASQKKLTNGSGTLAKITNQSWVGPDTMLPNPRLVWIWAAKLLFWPCFNPT